MPDDDFRLTGRWAVVTGSTRGIGKAIALELASAGANVIVNGRDAAAADAVCTAIRQLKRQAVAIVTDLATDAGRTKLVERTWSHQPIDVWVNNAGVDVLTGESASWTFEEKLSRLWALDATGTIELARACGNRMRERGSGVIINIGWDQAETGMEGDSGELFAAVKGAVTAFTRSLAKSLAPQVRVNCISPGWIRTAWGQTAPEYWQRRAVEESLVQRWGEPEDVARTVRFLASPAGSFINGQVIAVNGGRAN
ncbi:MAG: 3-oxoacyl-ACP reductase [Planctomycetota bacterium]|nr:MAG: 3-oxoacyl-ACP reductase [Planctomycetota bacterium]